MGSIEVVYLFIHLEDSLVESLVEISFSRAVLVEIVPVKPSHVHSYQSTDWSMSKQTTNNEEKPKNTQRQWIVYFARTKKSSAGGAVALLSYRFFYQSSEHSQGGSH